MQLAKEHWAICGDDNSWSSLLKIAGEITVPPSRSVILNRIHVFPPARNPNPQNALETQRDHAVVHRSSDAVICIDEMFVMVDMEVSGVHAVSPKVFSPE